MDDIHGHILMIGINTLPLSARAQQLRGHASLSADSRSRPCHRSAGRALFTGRFPASLRQSSRLDDSMRSNNHRTPRSTACRAACCNARRRSQSPSHRTCNLGVCVQAHRLAVLSRGTFVANATTKRTRPPDQDCKPVLSTMPC